MNTSLEQILEVFAHPNADKLELVKVLGYNCVVPKDGYSVGDKIIFIKPDSVLPIKEEWAQSFLQYALKRVKAIKLRGEWSEGLIVPIIDAWKDETEESNWDEILGVTHYEPPTPNELGAKAARLPFGIPKTDENRFENIYSKLLFGSVVDITLKIDGQSCSYYKNDEEFGVLSRGMELGEGYENNYTRHIGRAFDKDAFIQYCNDHDVNLCIRGESYGQGIQNFSINPHAQVPKNIAFFSVWNIGERKYEGINDKHYYRNVCLELGFNHVPLIEEGVILTPELVELYSKGLKKLNGEYFEGVVVKGADFSFKIINKHYDSVK